MRRGGPSSLLPCQEAGSIIQFDFGKSAASNLKNSTLILSQSGHFPAGFRFRGPFPPAARARPNQFPSHLSRPDIELHEIAYSAKEAAARRLTHTLLPHFVPPSDRDRDHPLTQPHLPEAWPESLTA